MFLWHFPSSRPDRTLSCTLPYEARTFLPVRRAAVIQRTPRASIPLGRNLGRIDEPRARPARYALPSSARTRPLRRRAELPPLRDGVELRRPRARVRSRSKPQGATITASGSACAIALPLQPPRVRAAGWPRPASPPASSTSSGIQCPALIGGSVHSKHQRARPRRPALTALSAAIRVAAACDELLRPRGVTRRVAQERHRCKTSSQRRRFERNDARLDDHPSDEASERRCFAARCDDLVRDRADGAELLRDDEIGREPLEQRAIEMIEARAGVNGGAHVTVDLARTSHARARARR